MMSWQAYGLDKVGRAHLDGGRAGQHHLDHVLGACVTPPMPTMGMLHRLVDLIDHPHAPRGNIARAGQAAGGVGQQRACGVRRSMRMPSRVLMRLTPSAPASSQALAMAAMSVTLGESLTMTGFFVTALTALVTSAAAFGSVPKAHAAAVDVGAGDVDLQPAHLLLRVQLFADCRRIPPRKSR